MGNCDWMWTVLSGVFRPNREWFTKVNKEVVALVVIRS